jgi:hypothetical protein
MYTLKLYCTRGLIKIKRAEPLILEYSAVNSDMFTAVVLSRKRLSAANESSERILEKTFLSAE